MTHVRTRPVAPGNRQQAAPTALAPQLIVGIGDALQLSKHVVGEDQLAFQEVGLDHRGQPAVDDGGGVDDLVRHSRHAARGLLLRVVRPEERYELAVGHEEAAQPDADLRILSQHRKRKNH